MNTITKQLEVAEKRNNDNEFTAKMNKYKTAKRYNIVIDYANAQSQENWNDMLFKALCLESMGRTAEEKKSIAEVLVILNS